jgi:hypothetical protein
MNAHFDLRQTHSRLSQGRSLSDFAPSLMLCAFLVVSGLLHVSLIWVTGAEWEGPLSPRKPGLFGISAGLTALSIVWVLTQLVPCRHDQSFATLMIGSLLIEVGLITLQYWRGVASHFNHATTLDTSIESLMLGLILFATAGIAWLCGRSRQLQPMVESCAVAIRAGLWLLLLSCGLGFLVTIVGAVNVANGRPPELWGPAGVLKYPHGVVLHAIQTLPLLSLLMERLRVPHAARLVRVAVASHVLFLTHALWQTFAGRTRFDVDAIGGVTLVAAGMLLLPPVVAVVKGAALIAQATWFGLFTESTR